MSDLSRSRRTRTLGLNARKLKRFGAILATFPIRFECVSKLGWRIKRRTHEAKPQFGGGKDVFVAKLTPSADTLIFATFLGGEGNETGLSLVVTSLRAVSWRADPLHRLSCGEAVFGRSQRPVRCSSQRHMRSRAVRQSWVARVQLSSSALPRPRSRNSA